MTTRDGAREGDRGDARWEARWDAELVAVGRAQVRGSRARAGLLVLGCLAFVAAGVWMWAAGGVLERVVAVVAVVFFGALGLPVGVRQLLRPARLEVTRAGLRGDGVRGQAVDLAWSDVEQVAVWAVDRNRFVVLLLTPEAAARRRADDAGARGVLTAVDEDLVGAPHVMVPGTYARPERLAAWLERVRARSAD